MIFKHAYFSIFVLAVLVSGCVLWSMYIEQGYIYYIDTDCYMRALRILDWRQDFQWREKMFPWSNPPDGFNLHFTRVMDVVWLLLSLPFMFFMPLKEAIFYSGFGVSPLFLVLTLLVLIKCYKIYIPEMHRHKVFFILCSAYSLMLLLNFSTVFVPYRPDHHSLMVFIFTFNMMVILCSYASVKIWEFVVAGLLSGLGILASSAVEGLIVCTSIIAVLCFDWICNIRPLKQLLFYTCGLFVGTFFMWLIDPPLGGYTVLDNNRLSIIHVVLTAFIFLSFTVLYLKNPQTVIKKIMLLLALGAVSIVSIIIIFGLKQFTIPVYDENVKEYFLPYVTEMFPVWKYRILLVMYALCFVEFGVLLLLSKGKLPYLNDLGIMMLIYMSLGCIAVRFCPYLLIIYVIINVFLFFVLMHLDFVAKGKKNIYKTSVFAIFVLTVGYMFSFHVNIEGKSFAHISIPAGKVCLTNLFDAPQLIFEKDIDTIGSPYHSNIQGIIDNHNIWYSQDENEVKNLLKKYNVQCIVAYKDEYGEKIAEKSLMNAIVNSKEMYPWLIRQNGYYEVDYTLF